MSDFDLTPPALPGATPAKKTGFFNKLFGKDAAQPQSAPPASAPFEAPNGPTPDIDEIKRKLGIDSEPDILPVPPTQNAPETEDFPRTPVAPPVGARVNVDDWTQDEAASTLVPVTAPATTPWDEVLPMDETPPSAPAKDMPPDAPAAVGNAAPTTDISPLNDAPEALPVVTEGTPVHHELIEKHLADLDRQHEAITQKLKEIDAEAPKLPEWKLQEKEITPDQYFFLRNGQPIRSISELAEALEFIDDITFEHHVNEYRNDFANWVRDVLENKDLAAKLQSADTRGAMLRELFTVKQQAAKETAKEQRDLQKTIAKRQEAVRTLLDAEKDLAELQHKLDVKSKELMGERKRAAKLIKDKLDAEVERKLKAERGAMLKARGELAAAKQAFISKTKAVEAREKSMAEREKRLLLDETQARKDIETVSRMKQEVEPMLRDAAKVKADLEAVRKTETSAKKTLAETLAAESSMTRKEESIRAREKKIADDLTRISTEKEQLAKLKGELDKRESATKKMEADARAMMADAKMRRDTALSTERASRERVGADMKRLALLKGKIDKELSKTLDQKQKITKAVGLRKQYTEALGETKRGIVQEREELEREGFKTYFAEKAATTGAGQPAEQSDEDVLKAKHTQVYAKVEACRQALETQDLEKAKSLYGELRGDYANVKLGPAEKEALYNDIRELYDDIHLMMLTK